jgi:hypothetical protein
MSVTAHYDPSGEPWPIPTPLIRPPPVPPDYPIDALGLILAPAARAIAEHTQVPLAIAANSVLATAALAAQAHANVETLADPTPISLYVLTIAESGARKTSADRRALTPVTKHIATLEVAYREAQDRTQNSDDESAPLRNPWILCSEPTAEGLFRSLQYGQFSQGVFSNEGGSFIGGHALSEESQLRTIAMLSSAWEGAPLNRVRAKDEEHTTLYGRRLSLHLMAQPEVAARLLSNSLYKNQGFLARVLVAQPASLAGTRLSDGKKRRFDRDPRFTLYQTHVTALLDRNPPVDGTLYGLAPRLLNLCTDARNSLVTFYNWIETSQAAGGEFEFHREWAGKAAEHACRIAGVLTLVDDPEAPTVHHQNLSNGIILAEFYVREYVRLVGAAQVSEDVQDAQLLLDWIKAKKYSQLTPRKVVQFGPYRLRSADRCSRALNVLLEHGWLRCGEGNLYHVHPSLVRGS